MSVGSSIASFASPLERGARSDPSRDEDIARSLEANGDFRVLRRLPLPPAEPTTAVDPSFRKAVFVDVETTGLDAGQDEIIEVGLLPFSYDGDGRIVALHPSFAGFRQPRRPIPPAIVALTGIGDDLVRGASIPSEALAPYLDRASLVVAHNASFDRGFLEKAFPVFRTLPWACSIMDVPWGELGIRHAGLEALAALFGFFYGAHRAVDDCRAAVEILGRPLPGSGGTVMKAMLDRARKPRFRIWAVGAPYDTRVALKGRGYRWHDGTRGGPRSWYRDVPAEDVAVERDYLENSVFGRRIEVPAVRLDAFDRYSVRSWRVPHAG